MIEMIEEIENGIKRHVQDGHTPRLIFIHPNKKNELGGLKEVLGVQVVFPSEIELQTMASITGHKWDSPEFWDENNVYLVPDGPLWDAYNSRTKMGVPRLIQ